MVSLVYIKCIDPKESSNNLKLKVPMLPKVYSKKNIRYLKGFTKSKKPPIQSLGKSKVHTKLPKKNHKYLSPHRSQNFKIFFVSNSLKNLHESSVLTHINSQRGKMPKLEFPKLNSRSRCNLDLHKVQCRSKELDQV